MAKELKEWKTELARSLSPHDDDDELKVLTIAKMYAVLASDRVSEGVSDVRVKTWLELLDRRSAREVADAARLWMAGEWMVDTENRAFVPRPAEFLRLCDKARDHIIRELGTIERILTAEDASAPRKPVAPPPPPKPLPGMDYPTALALQAKIRAEIAEKRLAAMKAAVEAKETT
jgi:hypothetical protein